MLKVIGICVGVLLALFALDFIIEGKNFFMYQFWAPKYENARREVYTNTLSYRKGSADRLANLCRQWKDNPDDTMLKAEIEHEMSDLNTSDVPDYLQGCLSRARS